MTISVQDIGKKYGRNWIFRHLSFEVEAGDQFALTGKNGSGKSTLLQIMAGYLTPSEGLVSVNDKKIEESFEISFIGPYTEIIEEFTLQEFLTFHANFKKPIISIQHMAERASLPLNRSIIEFSTGMKQRAKLITSFFFENDFIFMDEPTANLDKDGFRWWKAEIDHLKNKTILLASNIEGEKEIFEKSVSL